MIDLPAVVLVGIGGSVGALLRYGTTRALDAEAFPYGTLVVNALGSFVLGLVTFAGVGDQALLLVGVGGCGAFTTFSSFAHDTVHRFETGETVPALVNATGTLAAASAGVALAWVLVG